MQYTYDYNDQTYTVDISRQPDGNYRVVMGEAVYSVSASQLEAGTWLITRDGGQQIAHASADDERRFLHVGGQHYELTAVDLAARRRRGGRSGSGDLTAEMPGQVIDVRVAPGDSVTSGQVLVILEAMKMEIRVTASADGTVTALHVSPGDVVDRGQTLVELAAPAE